MTQRKSTNKSEAIKKSLDESSINILLKENEMLQTLFIHAENGMQSIFNFYLTLVTATVGGIAIIWQSIVSNPTQTWWAMFSISCLLVFIAISGSAYMSSLAFRYAHTVRYAQGINEIRRFLIHHSNIVIPPVYTRLLGEPTTNKTGRIVSILSMIIPVGTHQFFIAVVNSLAWAAAGYILLFLSDVPNYKLARSALLFLITFTVYNIYANFVIRRIVTSLHIRVEI